MKGFGSNALEGFDFKVAPGRERLVGDEANEILFIEVIIDGVRGVLASERARAREGVLSWLYIWFKEQ
jgi:hypothetical protein